LLLVVVAVELLAVALVDCGQPLVLLLLRVPLSQ
jgi:hypothetical protein